MQKEAEMFKYIEEYMVRNINEMINLRSRRILSSDLVANIMIRFDKNGFIYAAFMEDDFLYRKRKVENQIEENFG